MREGWLAEVKTLFESLVDLPPETRLSVLAERCSTDDELRAFVERMLANHDRGMGSFLEPLQPLVHPVSSRSESAIPSADSTALPPIFALGERVAERYRVERLLGQGGMGEVYEVWDDELAIPMALKTLRFEARLEKALRRLKQEALLARAVVHPNICRVYDLGRHGDADNAIWFLTMEVLRGETLRERLRTQGRFTPEEALPVVEQMAAGLAAAHHTGVVHGDFKSGNVMLVDSPKGEQAVIADFGLARDVRDRPDEGLTTEERHGIAGTFPYMAPEQVRGESAGTAADIYALGVVLYEMVTGSLPFTGSTPWEAALRRLEEPPPSPREAVPTLEERWEQVILRCLSREPRGRFAQVEEVADALAGRVPSVSFEVTPAAPRHRLPAELDAFVGREPELTQLHGEFANGARLVTLVGTAGMGKTRIAVRYGKQHLARWPGGVWFCDLTEARSLDGIVASVARSLGVQLGKGDAVTQLGQAIARRGQCLMILDNFEQVVEHASKTVSTWLGTATSARFLVTSRERLDLPEEELQAVEPLEFETSLALFLERARRLRPGLTLEGPALAAAQEVVRLVEGMPLAIELAAARMRVMSSEELLLGMRKQFRLLTGGSSLRHETLAAAIDGSWELLQPCEMAALAQSSVFDGGFTLEAAENVIGLGAWPNAPSVVEVVQSLVDKSLLRLMTPMAPRSTGMSETRFGMYASIHTYASGKLAEEGSIPAGMSGAATARAAEERHGAWYGRYGTDDSIERLDREGGVVRRRALQRELGNLLTACRRAVARRDEKPAVAAYRASWAVLELEGQLGVAAELGQEVLGGLRLGLEERANVLGILGLVEYRSGQMPEAHAHFEGALGIHREIGNRRSEGIILDYIGILCAERGRMEEARSHFEAAFDIAREIGNRRSEGLVLDHLGSVHKNQGRMAEARAHYEAALAIARELGNRRAEGTALDNLGNLHGEQGRMAEARSHFEAALDIHRELGNRRSEGHVLDHLAVLHYQQGGMEEARAHFEAALAIARELGNRRVESVSLQNLGCLHYNQGRMEEGRGHFEAALAIARELGDRRMETLSLNNLGSLHRDQGRMEEARAHHEAALAIAREDGDRRHEGYSLKDLGALHGHQGRIEGARACFEAALAIALELSNRDLEGLVCRDLGAMLFDQGRMEPARDYLERALATARELGNRRTQGTALAALADLNCEQGQMEEARGNYAAALAIARELRDRFLEGAALGGLGKQHLKQDRTEKARGALENGEAALREVSATIDLAKILITRAELECRTGDTATAAATLSEAEGIAEKVGAGAHSALGHMIAKLRKGILRDS